MVHILGITETRIFKAPEEEEREGNKSESDLCYVFVSVFIKRKEAAGSKNRNGVIGKKRFTLHLAELKLYP